MKVVQRILCHATVAVTLDLYGHRLDDDLNGVAVAVGKATESAALSPRFEAGKASMRKLLKAAI